jgi:hypothetical protein
LYEQYPFFVFLFQLLIVAIISFSMRKKVNFGINLIISSAFVTTPIWVYYPLSDSGAIFLFDIIVTIAFFYTICQRNLFIDRNMIFISFLISGILIIFIPIGYFFVDSEFLPFHSLIVSFLSYRALVITFSVILLAQWMREDGGRGVAKLAGLQTLALFTLGALQYIAGLDLVVYERIKDTENTVDILLNGELQILYGFGFLGLFRGAVPQMAILGLFWWLWILTGPEREARDRFMCDLMIGLAIICVVGSLSRVGLGAVFLALGYAALINRHIRAVAFLSLVVGSVYLLTHPQLFDALGTAFEIFADRFDPDQLSGQSGSGVTRLQSAEALFDAIARYPWAWLVGVGGFNPIAANELYGVFGLHGDYLDIIARYGVLVGLAYGVMVFALIREQLRGFFGRDLVQRNLSRSFALLAGGLAVLALTQGALTFSGTAGYLACAHSWLAIVYVISMRQTLQREGGRV